MQSSSRARAFGPGRVNLIGEHTDYNGGLSLPFAIEQGVTVRAQAAPGSRVHVLARDLGEEDEFDLGEPGRGRGWRTMVRGCVAELAAAGYELRPATLEIEGDLPIGAGLSSSAALCAAVCLALLGLTGEAEDVDRRRLAALCSQVENRWVGARTGLLDQLAVLFGRAEVALRIDFAAMEIARVPLELEGWSLVVVDSGERREHAASGYNERREECERACELLGLPSLSQATESGVAALPEPLARRARHVIDENARVDAAVAALTRGDQHELGRLLDASHASLRDLYEVSTSAVEQTVQRLKRAGAAGARLIGGGFGGAVLALMPLGKAAPDDALTVRPGAAARLVEW